MDNSSKKKQRCAFCNKKLKKVGTWTCECENIFCTKCRMPEKHNCTFDFSSKQKKCLEKQLVKVECEKIIKI